MTQSPPPSEDPQPQDQRPGLPEHPPVVPSDPDPAPVEWQSEPDPALGSVTDQAVQTSALGEPDSEDRNWAMAAHIGSFVSAWFALGLVAPLIVMLTKGTTSPFVRRHAVESLNFQINALIWLTVAFASLIILIGFVLLPAVGIFYLIVVIMGGIAASQGREFRYPLIFRFIT